MIRDAVEQALGLGVLPSGIELTDNGNCRRGLFNGT
jgi:hypothetical protein